MKFSVEIKVFGDTSYRGDCPTEDVEQKAFFKWLRTQYPKSYGLIAIHPRNEGKKSYVQAAYQKAEGQTKGASDIIIPINPPFVCELKRRDHTKSTWQDGQQEYLLTAKNNGSFVCVALGWTAAKEAFLYHLEKNL